MPDAVNKAHLHTAATHNELSTAAPVLQKQRSRLPHPAEPEQRKLASLVLAALGFKLGLQALSKPLCFAKNLCWVSARLHELGLLIQVNNGPWLDLVPSSARPPCRHTAHTSTHVTLGEKL